MEMNLNIAAGEDGESEMNKLTAAIPESRLAEVWCRLNRGEQHNLVSEWPANWNTMEFGARHDFIWPVMAEIAGRIGIKECLREWNRDQMNNQEFEDWWTRQRFPERLLTKG